MSMYYVWQAHVCMGNMIKMYMEKTIDCHRSPGSYWVLLWALNANKTLCTLRCTKRIDNTVAIDCYVPLLYLHMENRGPHSKNILIKWHGVYNNIAKSSFWFTIYIYNSPQAYWVHSRCPSRFSKGFPCNPADCDGLLSLFLFAYFQELRSLKALVSLKGAGWLPSTPPDL